MYNMLPSVHPVLVVALCLTMMAVVAMAGEDVPPPPPSSSKAKKQSLPAQHVQLAPPYYSMRLRTAFYILPMLNYSETGLEPYIDNVTVLAHYLGHHDAYQKNMNTVHEEWRAEHPDSDFAKNSVLVQMKNVDQIPDEYKQRFLHNAGGFINHAIYWACMSPNEDGENREPTGKLREEIETTFGSYKAFKEQFIGNATTYFGSGYVWLVRDSSDALSIVTTANQDCPISDGYSPLLVIDVWEHAYYLQWQFRRAKYVANWWMVVDWQNVDDMDYYFRTGQLAERWKTKWLETKSDDSGECLPPIKPDTKATESAKQEL